MDIIEEGDKSKQGDAVCPSCGERVLIGPHWGDPPQCHKCNVPYAPIIRQPDYH